VKAATIAPRMSPLDTWENQSGLRTLAALLGHSSIHMTMRYVHPAEEHKKEATGKIEIYKVAEAVKLAAKNQRVSLVPATMSRMN
jgi:hypothetical protein